MEIKKPNRNLILDPVKIIFYLLQEDIEIYLKKKRIALFLIFLAVIVLTGGIVKEDNIITFIGIVFNLGVIVYYFSISFNKHISKLSIVYLPISFYKIQGKAILVDRSGTIPTSALYYPFLAREEIYKAQEIFKNLKSLSERIPLILNHEKTRSMPVADGRIFSKELRLFGEEIEYLDYLERLQDIFKNAKSNDVTLPFFTNEINIIESLKAINHAKNGGLIIEKYKSDFIKNEILKIQGIIGKQKENKSANAALNIDNIITEIVKFLNYSAPRYDWSMSYSIREVEAQNIFRFINQFSSYSYNYYCPECNKKIVKDFFYKDSQFDGKTKETPLNFPETTKMVLTDVNKGLWRCPLCNHITDKPLTIHRMDDELFNKVYDKLYEENKNDRLKIYYDIINQKRKYSEKAETQFHTSFRENRSKREQIKSKIRSISAETNADTSIVRSLYLMMQKYDRISQKRINEFEAEINNIKEIILQDNGKALQELDQVFENAQQEIRQNLERYAKLEHIEQAARDDVQKKQLSSLQNLHKIEAARGEREKLFDRSNWNPFNWGYNLKRGVIKTVDTAIGMDEATTAKHLHQN